ncbi:MAG: MBL fold metallo-hydrolase [Actinobacteria bacterium]|nr:MBL fold metallo-hydrolase [Actinomycetota bacterium]
MRRTIAHTLLALVLVLCCTPPGRADAAISVLDVGQGDAIWYHDDAGYDVLIDAGEASRAVDVLDHLEGVHELDLVVWTHSHADHIGGMANVMMAMPVLAALSHGFSYDSATYLDLLDVVAGFGIPMTTARAGDTYTWGESTARVLHPDRRYLNENDNSVVIRLSHGDVDVLLTGDAEWEMENTLLRAGVDLSAEVLKVGHHGSNTSSYGAFLDAVQPEVAVISVGADNPYGHPSPAVLDRLAARGVATYRTDQDRTVTIYSNGVTYSVNAPLPAAESLVYVPYVLGPPAPEGTPTATATPTGTAAIIPTATATATATSAPTPTATASATQGPTATATVTEVPTATTTPMATPICGCSGDLYNCSDFGTRAGAQACYDYCLMQTGQDIHRLDSDGDGEACESLP